MTTHEYADLLKPLHERYATPNLPCDLATLDELAEEPVPVHVPTGSRHIVRMAYQDSHAYLRQTLLGHVFVQSHQAFEQLIIDVLLRMGYGARRGDLAKCLGRSHDGGIDGVITEDELGLDQIYMQAKRLKPNSAVPIAQVRDFVGSLEGQHASKGVFVTTAHFSSTAHSYVAGISRRVVLIDGNQLAELMIRHNIGVSVEESFQFKAVDTGYFASVAAARAKPVSP